MHIMVEVVALNVQRKRGDIDICDSCSEEVLPRGVVMGVDGRRGRVLEKLAAWQTYGLR